MGKGRRVLLFILVLALVLGGCGRGASSLAVGNRREIAEAVRRTLLNRSYRVRISFLAYTLDREGLDDLAAGLMEEALYESEDPRGGDYLRWQYGGYTMTHSASRKLFRWEYRLGILPDMYTDADQEAAVDERVKEILEDLDLPPEASEADRALAVRDYICGAVSYDSVHKHLKGSSHIQSTAYGALFYHTALCQGYAVLCYRLLKELGVENRIVAGTCLAGGRRERHVWNLVRIGDVFYNMDVTLDDVTGTRDYFLKSDRTFSSDHTREEAYASEDFTSQYPGAPEDYGF